MCVLVVCKPNHTPTKAELTKGACANPHGFGFAIVADGKIISERSMSYKKSIARFLELREQYPEGYAMWHARYATHGVKNEANCHPFQVGGSDLTYLAHNGILDVDIPQGDKRSDTRVFAEDILPQFGGVSALDNGTIWNMVSSWASGSKIAVLTVDPSAQYEMYLVNEKLGYWDDGVWFSNNACKLYPPVAKSYWQTPTASDKQLVVIEYDEETDTYNPDITYCIACEAIVDMEENPFNCPVCDACLDCTQPIADCLCYHPAWQAYYSRRSLEDMID